METFSLGSLDKYKQLCEEVLELSDKIEEVKHFKELQMLWQNSGEIIKIYESKNMHPVL